MAAALTLCALPLSAENVVEVHAPDNGGVTTAPLSTSTVISFKTQGLEISTNGSASTNVAYANAEKITFKTSESSVAIIDAKSTLRLRRNPVESILEMQGHDGKCAKLAVTSLSGQVMISLKEWNGEAIDVSCLTSGLYLLNINNQTFKFIKK